MSAVLCTLSQAVCIWLVSAAAEPKDVLLARRSYDAHGVAEAFFAGIVQAMHQIDGISFLVFAERGLWNRFVPSLDGYIQDRLSNPIHLPKHGTIKTLRLEAPEPELVRRIVEARLRPALEELPDFTELPAFFPFTTEQIERVARTEPSLRDMLQQFRQMFDLIVFGAGNQAKRDEHTHLASDGEAAGSPQPNEDLTGERRASVPPPPEVKSFVIVESPPDVPPDAMPVGDEKRGQKLRLSDAWDQKAVSARRRLQPR